MRNVSEKVEEEIKTHRLYSVTPSLRKLCRYEVMWKNRVETEVPGKLLGVKAAGA